MNPNPIISRPFEREVSYRTSRSGGSGGQHVNKVETRVELLFDVERSQLLDEEEKDLVREKLSNKMNAEGILIIVSAKEKSQLRNKKIAFEKLLLILENALKKRKKRKPVKPTKTMIEKRLKEKREQADKKRDRRDVDFTE